MRAGADEPGFDKGCLLRAPNVVDCSEQWKVLLASPAIKCQTADQCDLHISDQIRELTGLQMNCHRSELKLSLSIIDGASWLRPSSGPHHISHSTSRNNR